MKKYNITTLSVKTNEKTGKEFKKWSTVGDLTHFDNGGFSLELGMFPDTKFHVFEQEKKGEKSIDEVQKEMNDTHGVEPEALDVNPDDIPF